MTATRVLHLVHWLNRGGIETWLMHMLRSIDRREIEMDFCCKGANSGEMALEASALGAEVHHCPLGTFSAPFRSNFSRLIREGRYDVVHVHTGVFCGTPAQIATENGASVIASFHNVNLSSQRRVRTPYLVERVRSWYARRSVRQAYLHANLVTGCSQAVLDAIHEIAPLRTPRKEVVMRYGVPAIRTPSPEEIESISVRLGLAPSHAVILSIGSLRAQKNHDAVIRIASRVCSVNPNARFLIAGEGPLRAELENQISESGLDFAVQLIGKQSDIAPLLAISKLFLFPSKWEGLGIVALEAQMCRVPVIGSKLKALYEATLANESSLLFDVSDESGMSVAILKLLRDEKRRQQMGERGRAFVENAYSLVASRDSLASLYRDTIAQC